MQESARKSRVASTFLPLAGPVPRDQVTVPANWMTARRIDEDRARGEADERLVVRSGKTLHLVTIASNVYLRGSEAADPQLEAAKSMVRRAAEVLGRLEDAIVFNGVLRDLPSRSTGEKFLPHPGDPSRSVVEPAIYTISGGRDLTGLLQAPDTFFEALVRGRKNDADWPAKELELKKNYADYRTAKKEFEYAEREFEKAAKKVEAANPSDAEALGKATRARDVAQSAKVELTECKDAARKAIELLEANEDASDVMCVKLEDRARAGGAPLIAPVVKAVISAVEKLERHGHFGPFAAVFGDELFRTATSPSGTAAVLPSDQFLPFLNGGPLHRSSTIPRGDGLIIALGGSPIELVLGTDMTVRFLQMTLEPRYVLRVFEKLVLRIKELDAVCRITGGRCLDEDFEPRKADA